MIRLTNEQKAAMLQLGDPDFDEGLIAPEIVDQLIRLRLLVKQDDGYTDFTDAGKEAYEDLKASCPSQCPRPNST